MKRKILSQMAKPLLVLPILLGMSVPYVYGEASHEDIEKRISKLEKKQKKLDRQIKKNAKKNQKKLDDLSERFKINGFFSAGLAQASEDISVSSFGNYDGINEDICTDCSTVLGLQMEFQVSDNVSAVGQFLSGNAVNRELQTDWGFLRFNLSPKTTFRAGRLITPFYAKSQYQMVGFATPWASLPTGYVRTARYFDGVDLKQQFSLGGINSSVTAMFGNTRASLPAWDYVLQDVKGLAFESNINAFSFRLNYFFDYNVSLTDNGSDPDAAAFVAALDSLDANESFLNDAKTDYLTLGFEYDDGKNLVLAEYAATHFSKGNNKGFLSYYLTYARRFQTWMPYLRFEHFEYRESNRGDRTLQKIEEAQAGLTALTTQAQDTLTQIASADAATGQAMLQGLADVISVAVGQPEIAQGVSAGVIDAHDMTQIVAGIGSSIAGLSGVANFVEGDNSGEQNTYTVGLRKELTSQIAITAEYSLYTDFGDHLSYGEFNSKTDDDDIKVYRIVLDAVF